MGRVLSPPECASGTATLAVQPCEAAALTWALKSLVAREPLSAGTRLRADMLIAKRPGDGLPAYQLEQLVGRRLTRGLAADEAVTLADVEV